MKDKSVGRQSQCEHERETAGMGQQRDQEGVGALRGIAAGEVAGPPAQHCRQAETDRHELFRQSHFPARE